LKELQVMAMEPWLLVVLLGGFTVVCGLMLPRKKEQADNDRSVQEMQTALEQLMENIEADNRDLVNAVSKAAQHQREDNAARDERIAGLELRLAEMEQHSARMEARVEARIEGFLSAASNQAMHLTLASVSQRDQAASIESDPAPVDAIRFRYPELFELHAAGKSVDIIAKKIGMNKGEVMLILQLSKQEEESRA
jgi:hypothetical protein